MSEPAKDFDLEHWKEVCYALEFDLESARAENARLREALVYIGKVCISHDRGDEAGRALGHIADYARAALEVEP